MGPGQLQHFDQAARGRIVMRGQRDWLTIEGHSFPATDDLGPRDRCLAAPAACAAARVREDLDRFHGAHTTEFGFVVDRKVDDVSRISASRAAAAVLKPSRGASAAACCTHQAGSLPGFTVRGAAFCLVPGA